MPKVIEPDLLDAGLEGEAGTAELPRAPYREGGPTVDGEAGGTMRRGVLEPEDLSEEFDGECRRFDCEGETRRLFLERCALRGDGDEALLPPIALILPLGGDIFPAFVPNNVSPPPLLGDVLLRESSTGAVLCLSSCGGGRVGCLGGLTSSITSSSAQYWYHDRPRSVIRRLRISHMVIALDAVTDLAVSVMTSAFLGPGAALVAAAGPPFRVLLPAVPGRLVCKEEPGRRGTAVLVRR